MLGPDLTGVLHFEAKYNVNAKDGQAAAMPIECNLRVGGAETQTNVLTTWGVDLAQAALRLSLGGRPVLPPCLRAAAQASKQTFASQAKSCVQDATPLAFVSSSNFVPPNWVGAGIVEKAELSAAGLADPQYVDHEVYFKIGSLARLPPAGFVGLGWMVAQSSKSIEDAEVALARVACHLDIRLRKPKLAELA
eukprot:gene4295-14405_t